jgi:hypothetical protein
MFVEVIIEKIFSCAGSKFLKAIALNLPYIYWEAAIFAARLIFAKFASITGRSSPVLGGKFVKQIL